MSAENGPARYSGILKIGGYLLLVGSFLGVSLEALSLTDSRFLRFIGISQYEATTLFLGAYLPAFIVAFMVGYFVATSRLSRLGIWRTTLFCTLVMVSLVLSALSIYNLLSMVGAVLTLAALVLNQTEATFKSLWKREASFLMETSGMLIAAGNILFLTVAVIASSFQTYHAAMDVLSYGYPHISVVITLLSLLTFVVAPFLGLYRNRTGMCGLLGLSVGLLSLSSLIQSQYIYSNPVAYQGIFLTTLGSALMLIGSAAYIKLSFTESVLAPSFEPKLVYKGKYCPFCGQLWKDSKRDMCSACGRTLSRKAKTSFCYYCGRLIIRQADNCPHCGEDTQSFPICASLVRRTDGSVLTRILDRTSLSFKELVIVCIITALLNFAAFVAYARTTAYLPNMEYTKYYGLPLEWLVVYYRQTTGVTPHTGQVYPYMQNTGLSLMWSGFILDLMIYFFLALSIVYAIKKLISQFR